ncbi:CBS domain-containing protein [Sulfurisphaera javensis]|uniref:CBS domain-containing protein n=1 Tax=Sulfurisphaera javensis TaxID=2049879 RepID=A0AAT9GSE6_9CREN
MLIKTLMITNPPIVSTDSKLLEAFKKVNEKGIGRVIVVDKEIKGIISTRDLLTYVVERCENGCDRGDIFALVDKDIKHVMTPNPVFVYEKDDVLDALTLMVARNFGSLPVVNEVKQVTGIVTEREMLLLFQDLDSLFSVKKFMTKRVTTVYEDVPIFDATKLMIKRGFRRLPITDEDGKIIGIITAADSLKLLTKAILKNEPEMFFSKKVKEVATNEIYSIDPEKSINEAAITMLMKKIGSLLILDSQNKPLGIITERDLIIALHYQLHLKAS